MRVYGFDQLDTLPAAQAPRSVAEWVAGFRPERIADIAAAGLASTQGRESLDRVYAFAIDSAAQQPIMRKIQNEGVGRGGFHSLLVR
jgi:hypothetical protein